MKKFLFIILAVLLLMPVTSAFANPNAASNTNYVYLMPQEDGTVLYVSKFIGVTQPGIEFVVPTSATNVKAVTDCEVKDGKIVSTAKESSKKIEFQYNLKMENNEFTYVSPLENTSVTFLTPKDKGLVSSTEIDLETDTSGAGDFNADGIDDYFFAAYIETANKPIKFIYDQSAKASETTKTEQGKDDQTKAQENNTKVTPADTDNTTLYIVLGTLGVVLVAGVGLYFYFRSQNSSQKDTDSTDVENEDEFVKLAQQRKDILSKISELQANLEAGLITEEEQSEKEKVLREKLTKITVQIKEFTE